MPASTIEPPVLRRPTAQVPRGQDRGLVAHPPPRHPLRRILLFALVGVVAATLVGAAGWALIDRATEDEPAATATPGWVVPTWAVPTWTVTAFEGRLVRAGYAVRVNGVLDPVTMSAAGDFIRASDWRQLDPWLANALGGTAMTGRRDPTAWNQRFGTDRATRMVERPLTGPGGQLDNNGNIRNGGYGE